MKRMEAARLTLAAAGDDALVVVCNGMIGREVWTLGDRSTHFYMIGSMGLASSVALGLAIARPDRRVVCIDGDGNALMGMGVFASIAAAGPRNLFHVILDNEAHGSTGGQATISAVIPLEKVALVCGYTWTARVAAESALMAAAPTFFLQKGPACLLAKVERGNVANIGRVALTPEQLTARMRETAIARA